MTEEQAGKADVRYEQPDVAGREQVPGADPTAVQHQPADVPEREQERQPGRTGVLGK